MASVSRSTSMLEPARPYHGGTQVFSFHHCLESDGPRIGLQSPGQQGYPLNGCSPLPSLTMVDFKAKAQCNAVCGTKELNMNLMVIGLPGPIISICTDEPSNGWDYWGNDLTEFVSPCPSDSLSRYSREDCGKCQPVVQRESSLVEETRLRQTGVSKDSTVQIDSQLCNATFCNQSLL